VGENPALAAIRAGMVSLVPLTILGGLFLVLTHLPWPGGATLPAAWKPVLEVPVTATFGLLAVFACFAIDAPPFARTYGVPFSNF
jgi:PTS system cellobiose-specific IIC component